MFNTPPSRSIALLIFVAPHFAMAADRIEFNRSVLPILSNHCYPCHGPDSKKRKAKLRLDQRESARKKNPPPRDDRDITLLLVCDITRFSRDITQFS